jgi:hypothetical protein
MTAFTPTSLFEFVRSQNVDALAVRHDRGAGSRNRTHDQRFTKPLLYQLSYAGRVRDFTRADAAEVAIKCEA